MADKRLDQENVLTDFDYALIVKGADVAKISKADLAKVVGGLYNQNKHKVLKTSGDTSYLKIQIKDTQRNSYMDISCEASGINGLSAIRAIQAHSAGESYLTRVNNCGNTTCVGFYTKGNSQDTFYLKISPWAVVHLNLHSHDNATFSCEYTTQFNESGFVKV